MSNVVYVKASTSLAPYPVGPPPPVSPPSLFQTSGAPASGYSMLVKSQPAPQAHELIPQGRFVDYGQQPSRVQCQHCGAHVITSTERRLGSYAWLMGVLIFFLGGCLGCCLIPCFMDSCKDVTHTCPFCGSMVGRYKRLKGERR